MRLNLQCPPEGGLSKTALSQTRAWRTQSRGVLKFTLAAGVLHLPRLNVRARARCERHYCRELRARRPQGRHFVNMGKLFHKCGTQVALTAVGSLHGF